MLQSKSKLISGIYLAVDYHPNINFILNKIAKEFGIEPENGYDQSGNLREYKYHTTILYSKFKKPLPADSKLCNFQTKSGSTFFQIKKPKISVPVKIIGFDFFDIKDKHNKPGINFHVRVDSPFLKSEFKRGISFGLPTDFPQYTPHITLSNTVSKEFRDSLKNASNPDYKKHKAIISKYIGTVLYTSDEYIEELD